METKHLKLSERNIENLKNAGYSDQTIFDLKVQSEKLMDSPVLNNQLETRATQEKALNIFSEAKKEVEVQKIDVQTHLKVDTVRKRINSRDRQQFTSALEKVKSFYGKQPSPVLRTKSAKAQIQKLSIQEKKAVSNFFERFASLNKDQLAFFDKLTPISGDRGKDRFKQSVCISCIPQNLKKIGWDSPELNIFEEHSSFKSHPSLPYMHYQQKRAKPSSAAKSAWGAWSPKANPYYELFSSESEWLNYVEEISKSWKSYYSYMNSPSRIATTVFSFGIAGTQDKGRLERKINDSKAALELSIGNRLMNLMKQLD